MCASCSLTPCVASISSSTTLASAIACSVFTTENFSIASNTWPLRRRPAVSISSNRRPFALEGHADRVARGAGLVEGGIVAVEILAARELEPSLRPAQHGLAQADRVGHRHHDDLAAQAPGRLQRRQPGAQVVGGEHAGQFVGMQRGLQVGLAAAVGRAVVETGDAALGARRAAGQRVVAGLHALRAPRPPPARRSAAGTAAG